ncbi:acetate--CoA ligase family protein [Streptomyces sp. NPDC048430]|uniref:acetate--CoA ligase family protein n=1 Tax=Streptomyces sp. NPDC048430 TaxID=3155388 RepID=UPI003437D2AA
MSVDESNRLWPEPATLDRLFEPRSVAVVGASDDVSRIGGRLLRYLLSAGFRGRVFPVNLRRKVTQGVETFASVANLPLVPDVALLAVPAESVLPAVKECAAAGVPAVVVLSAGFSELGARGAEMQRELTDVARRSGMRLLGPNCLGVFNSAAGFFGTFANAFESGFPSPGPVGVVSQSGAYGAHAAALASRRGLDIRYWITTGNEADVDVAAALSWMARRPDVEVILAYLEGVKDGPEFVEALRVAHEHATPVVLVKVGSSESGARAAQSHTASLAGVDAVLDGLVEQFGAIRATTTEEQLDLVYLLARGVRPSGERLGIVTVSGGAGVQLCDSADRNSLVIPTFDAAVQGEVVAQLPYAMAANPVDVTAQALQDLDGFRGVVDVVVRSGQVDALVVFLTTTPDAPQFADGLRKALREAGSGPIPVVLVMVAAPATVAAYEEAGFSVCEDGDRAVRALAGAVRVVRAQARSIPAARSRNPVASLPEGPLNEFEAGRVVSAAGLGVVRQVLATSVEEAVAHARTLGYPVAVKVCSPDIAHKTDVGGVELGVADEGGLRRAYEDVRRRARERRPTARIDGVLVAEMIRDPGVETIIGVQADPIFGPVVLVGMGGVLAEIMQDVSLRLAPFGPDEAHRMLSRLRGGAVLDGVRGSGAVDRDALARALAAVSEFAFDHAGELESIDLNPVLVQQDGVVALDAVVITKPRVDGHRPGREEA